MKKYNFKDSKVIKEIDLLKNLHSWSAQGNLDPIVVEKAKGIYFWDSNGKKYFDMSSQLVNVNIGHGNMKVIEAIQEQAEKMTYMGPGFAVDVKSELASKLLDIAPKNMKKVFFTIGGADANENAIKMAKMFTGRDKIFSRYRSYHGATYGAANLTGEPRRFPAEPGIPGFIKFFDPYLYRSPVDFKDEEEACNYYLEQLTEQIIYEGRDSVAAIFLETVTGSNGVIIPPENYLKGVREICDEFGILMVCDEIMAGFGRTGEWFACDNWGVVPDLITFAKGITSGYLPLGGVLVSQDIADFFNDTTLMCGLTYSGHPMGCAAGIATLDVYQEEGLIKNSKLRGKVLGEELELLKEKHPSVGDVRYIGLFSAIELVKDKVSKEPLVPYGQDPGKIMPLILSKLIKQGFFTYTHENIIIVAPPLIIKEEEIKEAMQIMDRVLSEVDEMLK
ncbi:aminotransferase class III-fold pyridoxal phosphate-dependent enzyme [Iocasia frigidifontis]|uniref:Aminotransferase class III-fold pyridoxal phosphate-dependent enzyme n=1 Tax=Iocasia fonsfrigidae TaxID=2682810 RepID=A0A8A7K7R3_9FIRM|nr:aminotransferase class III-fold pyridoxal phosphate-dependent enzyme [Iocasia fonsfrigidae]QTL97756.1 aminotransferase class III-fold pyridoxal phosphate-dependent enzyme [Iocasia fonsfrigidae]